MLYEETSLWKRTLAPQSGQLEPDRAELRQAYLGFRKRVEMLVNEIGGLLPDLTVHDISHLDALWRVTDEIAGPNYPINPAEAFVLGGSFLLHDSAHVLAAYEDGLKGLKMSVEWKDLIAQKFNGKDPSPGSAEEKSALFQILRLLHASQARKLVNTSWTVPSTGDVLYLLEHNELRDYYGDLVGEISESHHWPIQKVVDVFEDRYLNPPAFFATADWTVDALKVAILLRNADAAHIDAARAPWFLFALRCPDGISKDHWHFQAKMGKPVRTSKGELRLSSGSPFGQKDQHAWWLAYDVAQLIDRELRNSKMVLRDCGREPLATMEVENISEPEKFAKNVRVRGWEPVSIAPSIGNVNQVIQVFGGEALYGKHPTVAIRELVQNAADAIRALSALLGDNKNKGKIDVFLEARQNEDWLHVTDNGIGMSRFVLTNVLLDFGCSLWKEDSLRTELPGLASSGFSAMGRFGIGFFSIFMIGSVVSVTTNRYVTAAVDSNDQWTLSFLDGLNSRPTLTKTIDTDRLTRPGTRVSVQLNEAASNAFRSEGFSESAVQQFRGTVTQICPTLDSNVYVRIDGGTRKQIVKPNDWLKIEDKRLLQRTSKPQRSVKLTKLVNEEGEVLGRVGYHGEYSGAATVTYGGIAIGKVQGIAGVVKGDNSTDLARARAGPSASREAWQRWAKNWIDMNHEAGADALIALHPLCPHLDLSVYQFDGKAFTEGELCELFKSRDKIKAISGYPVHEEDTDDVSSYRFENSFELNEDILVLPSNNHGLANELGFTPVDYFLRFENRIKQIWLTSVDLDAGMEAVGAVDTIEIFRDTFLYGRDI